MVDYLCGDVVGLQLNSVLNEHKLFCHQWKPAGLPRVLLCLCHGVTEHTQRYHALGEHLAQNQILMFGHDHVGHGRSEGERVYIDSVDTYVQDVIQHIVEVKRRHPTLPCLLMGHSMGGLIAAHVAVQKQELIQGLVLSSAPTAQLYNSAPKKLIKPIVRAIAAIIPKKPLIPWNPRAISSMPTEVEPHSSTFIGYMNSLQTLPSHCIDTVIQLIEVGHVTEFSEDPLVYHGLIRFSWVRAMITAMDRLEGSLSKITIPILLIHGSEDVLVPISCSEHLFEAVSSTDKIFEVFAGNYHEVLHDSGQTKAISAIKQWILNHI